MTAMEITVLRDTYTDQSVTSEVLLNRVQKWYGIEPPNRPQKPCCIPAGTYLVVLGHSEHFDMTVPIVQGVAGFSGIEIHPGNFPRDTHGCLCIGEDRGPNDVIQSRVAFDELMSQLAGEEDISITYVSSAS